MRGRFLPAAVACRSRRWTVLNSDRHRGKRVTFRGAGWIGSKRLAAGPLRLRGRLPPAGQGVCRR
jgi:hypothetical protein